MKAQRDEMKKTRVRLLKSDDLTMKLEFEEITCHYMIY